LTPEPASIIVKSIKKLEGCEAWKLECLKTIEAGKSRKC
jgi:hypothetical protein